MSNTQIFGSDDDSDSESESDTNMQPPTTNNSNNNNDDDDDDDTSTDNPSTTTTTTPNNTTTTPTPTPTNDDDSDEDQEFDGGDDIVGQNAPPSSTTATTTTINNDINNRFENSDDDDENNNNLTQAKPRHMTVLDLPNRPPPTTKRLTYHTAQLPNIIAIQPKAFNPDTFRADVEDRDFQGNVHGMIRWRYRTDAEGELVRDGNNRLVRESNTKLIRWSDGSFGLSVGDELFDMDEFKCAVETNAESSAKEFLYLTQKAQYDDNDDDDDDDSMGGGAGRGGTVLECASALTSKFIPRVATLDSTAHKNFVLGERNRILSRARVAEIVTFADPEKEKMERIKDKTDLAKQQGGSGGGGGQKRRRTGGGKRSYHNREEEDQNYDSFNISNAKKRSLGGQDSDYDEDSGGDDAWSTKRKSRFESGRRTGRAKEESEEEESEEEFFEEEDEEEEVAFNKGPKNKDGNKRTSNALIDDDDDDDSE